MYVYGNTKKRYRDARKIEKYSIVGFNTALDTLYQKTES